MLILLLTQPASREGPASAPPNTGKLKTIVRNFQPFELISLKFNYYRTSVNHFILYCRHCRTVLAHHPPPLLWQIAKKGQRYVRLFSRLSSVRPFVDHEQDMSLSKGFSRSLVMLLIITPTRFRALPSRRRANIKGPSQHLFSSVGLKTDTHRRGAPAPYPLYPYL